MTIPRPSQLKCRATRAGRLLCTLLCVAMGALFGSLGCSAHEGDPNELWVFAAASLSESFSALAAAFEAEQPDLRVRLHTAGSAQLVLQLREGARADVFASADEASMFALLEHLRTADSARAKVTTEGIAPQSQVFAQNRLALLVAAGNPLKLSQLSDLGRPELRFAMAGPQVPAGRYARQALALAQVEARSRSDEASVRGVVQKVLLGELDAGIVYSTDRVGPASALELLPIPAAFQPEIRYPIVALSPASPSARAFVAFVLSDSGQSILSAHGFGAAR